MKSPVLISKITSVCDVLSLSRLRPVSEYPAFLSEPPLTPPPPDSDLFQSALHVDALVPRGCRIGETVAGVPPPGNVHLLPSQVPEGLSHHHHPIVCQRRCVLGENECAVIRQTDAVVVCKHGWVMYMTPIQLKTTT